MQTKKSPTQAHPRQETAPARGSEGARGAARIVPRRPAALKVYQAISAFYADEHNRAEYETWRAAQ